MKHYITIALCTFLSQMCTAQVMMLFSQDSLTGIVSPLDVDSLFYWFAADVGVTDSLGGAIATDEGVGTWNDLSGNGHHVTQSTDGARPVWKATGGPGGYPCIQFDGSNDFLASAAHFWGSDDLTVFVVMKFGNATRDAVEAVVSKWESTGNNRQWILRGDAAVNSYAMSQWALNDGVSANNIQWTYDSKNTSYRMYSNVGNGSTTLQTYIDGSNVTNTTITSGTGDGTIYNTTNNFGVGAINTANTPLFLIQGSISEIIVYSRALTATERTAIENYLNRKYDLYAAADSTRDELLNGPKTPSKILTAYETLRKIDGYKCALDGMDRKEIEEYLNKKYTLYYLIIIGFPLASARRRKLIPNEKKNAA